MIAIIIVAIVAAAIILVLWNKRILAVATPKVTN
jgi:hypothetical protein